MVNGAALNSDILLVKKTDALLRCEVPMLFLSIKMAMVLELLSSIIKTIISQISHSR